MDMRDRLAIGLIGAGTLFSALPAAGQHVAPITTVIKFAGLIDCYVETTPDPGRTSRCRDS